MFYVTNGVFKFNYNFLFTHLTQNKIKMFSIINGSNYPHFTLIEKLTLKKYVYSHPCQWFMHKEFKLGNVILINHNFVSLHNTLIITFRFLLKKQKQKTTTRNSSIGIVSGLSELRAFHICINK